MMAEQINPLLSWGPTASVWDQITLGGTLPIETPKEERGDPQEGALGLREPRAMWKIWKFGPPQPL